MKHFLAVFTGSREASERSGWNALTEQEQQVRTQEGIQAWYSWMQNNAARIVVPGGPVGVTKRVSPAGIEDDRNNLCGYLVIAAESHEAAARLFEGHPHFSIFPGDAVEIMECLPIPGPAA